MSCEAWPTINFIVVGFNPEPTACSLIKIVVDGTEHIIDGLEVTDSDGNITNFAKIRSLAPLLGYDVNSVGAMPVLTKK